MACPMTTTVPQRIELAKTTRLPRPGQRSPGSAGTPSGYLSQVQDLIRNKNRDLALQSLTVGSQEGLPQEELWDAWTDLGELFYESNEFSVAEECYRKAQQLLPTLMASHFNLAAALQMKGELEEALENYLKAGGIQSDAKVWGNVGTIWFLRRDFVKSELALKTALAIDPNYTRAWDNLASTLGAQGKIDEAIYACRRALERRPDHSEASFKLGVLYFAKERWADALPLLEMSLKHLESSGYVVAFLSITHSRLGNLRQATHLIQEWPIEDAELLARAWAELGSALVEQGHPRRTVAQPGNSAAA